MCIMKACEELTAAGVYWRDDEEWKQYAAPQAVAIRRGLAHGAGRIHLGTLVSSKYVRGADYVMDFKSMTQINLATGFTRDVKVVNVDDPAIGTTMSSYYIDSVKQKLQYCQKVIASRGCEKEIMSLKESVLPEIMTLNKLVMKLEADLLAVNSKLDEATNTEANPQPRDHWTTWAIRRAVEILQG